MGNMTIKEAMVLIDRYKQQNQQLLKALEVIHEYVDISDARLEEEGRSREDILKEARKLKQEYEKTLYVGLVIPNIAN